MKQTGIVIGAGIAGLLSAQVLTKYFNKIIIDYANYFIRRH